MIIKRQQTLSHPVQAAHEEKRSRFICHIWPCTSREAGFAHLAELRRVHPDARHICWAYNFGGPGRAQSAGCNDDGEPGGTAGKPMLNVLKLRDVSDTFCCVVRYFGGIKLGAGGLVRAYGQAVSVAIDQAVLIEQVAMVDVALTTGFADEERVRHCLQQYGVTEFSAEYGESVTLRCQCAARDTEALEQSVRAVTAGRARVRFQRQDH